MSNPYTNSVIQGVLATTTIKANILELLYAAPVKYYNSELRMLRAKNAKEWCDPSALNIIYLGKTYIDRKNARALHPNLVKEMEAYLENTRELRNERCKVMRFLAIVLSDFKNIVDLRAILGNYIIDNVKIYFVERNEPRNNKLNNFITEHQHIMSKLNERIFDNTLMASVYKL